MSESIKTIAIIGGTGKLGKGLAYQIARTGRRVIIGSRQEEKAQASALIFMNRLYKFKGAGIRIMGEPGVVV